ncbi:MAG: hypothetical protein LM549_00485, partial [Candidatus Competibacter sp.]|nr:hypothetical protein [Candidatus Competibacter sp.]
MACLSRCVGFVPVVSVALRSARCRVAPWGGSALGLSFRRSRRSLSGFVAVARFSSFAAASRFAWSWGRRLPARPGFCAVRAVAGGFAVSVPVLRAQKFGGDKQLGEVDEGKANPTVRHGLAENGCFPTDEPVP